MSSLNNAVRYSIVQAAIKEKFDPLFAELEKAEHELAMRCYEHVFSAEARRVAAKFVKSNPGWVRMDSCLRFNADGWDVRFNLTNTSVPVPVSQNGCNRLGALTGDLAAEARAHVEKSDELRNQKASEDYKLRTTLNAISSFRKLETLWPEGSRFYAKYRDRTTANAAGLPVSFAGINAMFGLSAADAEDPVPA